MPGREQLETPWPLGIISTNMTGKNKNETEPTAVRNRRFEFRLSEQELQHLKQLERVSGISGADIVRLRVLKNSDKTLINAGELMKRLDVIGTELARAGNNINQLARHANTLQKQGILSASVTTEFNELLIRYVRSQQDLESALRQLIRLMKS